MELGLPMNYVELDQEEMMYLDEGLTFSRGWVSTIIDAVATPFCWYLAPIKFMGKQAASA
ncbi:hypothetical protein AOC36_07925 [Erysipelothrix larvae]|uniref:Uncharacterized protein n=1 Tax=Erysipelothrix larvae TaxID=1514105 RepID=A0A0X8H128_9FIRM|nr:hypothetical protein [Erysipelothrix larvae]AMC93914.1 hypothetical protein AOC36_07925 [Erysipelothrix larvae]